MPVWATTLDRRNRREFISLLSGTAVAWPLAARAQQPERIRRIGVLMGYPEAQSEFASFARTAKIGLWGTSSPEDKLAGDLGNVIGATSIGGRRSDFFYSKKFGTRQFGTFATISARTRSATVPCQGQVIGVKRTAMLRRGNAGF